MTRAERLAEAQQMRAQWKAAYTAISTGQSYTIGGRRLERADAAFVREEFFRWDRIARELEVEGRDRVQVFRVMPRDL